MSRIPEKAALGRVLVVDDNHDAAQALAYLLEEFGYEAACVHHGLDAHAKALKYKPAAVLLDLGLPGLTGYEVARRLRSSAPPLDAVLIIAISGYASDADRERCRDAGIDHHFAKPVAFPDIDAVLRARLARTPGRPPD